MICMPCGHTFCKKCLEELKLHSTGLKCPTFRTDINNQAPNFELINELNSRRLQRNSSNISNNKSLGKTENQAIPLIKPSKEDFPNTNLKKVKKNNLKYKLALIVLAIVLIFLLVIIIGLAIIILLKVPFVSDDISMSLNLSPSKNITENSTNQYTATLFTSFMPNVFSPGSLIFNLVGHFNTKQSLVKIEDDDCLIASGSLDTIIVWNVTDGTMAFNLSGHNGPVRVLVSYGNNILVSAHSDNSLIIWDLKAKNISFSLFGHTDSVETMVKIDDNLLASGSADKTIKIWNLTSAQLKHTLSAHYFSVHTLAKLESNLLASASDDTRVLGIKSF